VIVAGGRKCGCGRLGCWESYASATGLIKTTAELLGGFRDSLLWEICGGSAEKLNGRAVFDAYRAGDEAARLAVGKYIEHLGTGLLNIINMLDPQLICIGGGISNEWDCLEEPILAMVGAERFFRSAPELPSTKIAKAQLGNDAGIIGAALLGRKF
jgi:glucokinase